MPFVQWIDGSFVATKDNPKDIDMVTFIDAEIYKQLEPQIDNEFSKWAVNKYYKGLDAYTVWTFQEEHKNYHNFKADYAYWYDWFSRSHFNRLQKRYPKGFIQIKFL